VLYSDAYNINYKQLVKRFLNKPSQSNGASLAIQAGCVRLCRVEGNTV